MHAFADLDAVHATLDRLAERELVARLERRPGQKEERYSQLLEDRETAADALAAGGPGPSAASGTAPAGGFVDADAGDSRAPGADGWQAPNGEQQPSSAGAATLRPQAARSPAPAASGSAEPLASLAGLHERLVRLELEVAELRTALDSYAGAAKATASPRQVSPEAAVTDQASREWS
jgi:uncharacterized protein YceH (UPF0502 family)